MIDHSNWCLILTDGWCSCKAQREPVLTFPAEPIALCGPYCKSDEHCEYPDCDVQKPHVKHEEWP